MKTLIVEDDAASRLIISRVLTERGHKVSACKTAEQAIEICKKELYVLMVLDLHLPGLDGLDFCRWVRSQTWGDQVFILVATARNQTEDLQAVLTAGGNDYLAKPFDIALLKIRLAIAERQIKEIAGRRQAQELNKTILRTTMDGFWLMDPSGRILDVNEAYCRMSGYDREELLVRQLHEIAAPELAPFVSGDLDRIVRTGGESFETRHRCKDGRIVDLDVSINFVKVDGGRLFAFFRDITERKKLAEEKNKTSKLESIGLLAGGIAHEFNNALTVIMGNLALVQSDTQPGCASYDFLNSAEEAASKATDLARQLLTFAKGGEPLKKIMGIGDLLEQTAQTLVHGSKIETKVSIQQGLWLTEIDPAQIVQVIENLVKNGREAMPNGGILQVEAQNATLEENKLYNLPAGKYVRFSILDTGYGIPPEVLPKIFDPYFTTKESGNGLGLAICYSIIRKHGGLITVESQPSFGSSFTVYLPASKNAPSGVQEQLALPVIETETGKVLLMDDDPAIRELTSIILSRFGYSVVLSRDGEEALEIYSDARIRGEPFDAVVMDLTVPEGMGGKAALQELMKIDPEVKAIVCSGYSNDPVMANFQAYGFKARLHKPFTGDDLNRTIVQVIRAEA
jgi:PAS domain S-box-containing protein